jgi:hypothetical protein
VFERIGLFDERLVRNQDDEFNYRIRRAGGRIYVSPRVKYTYFVRTSVRQLFKQYFQYGFWRIPVIEKHGRPTTLRQIAPTLFYLACVLLVAIGLWSRELSVAVMLPAIYTSALVLAGMGMIRSKGIRVVALVPLAIATMHAGYAWGLAYGMWARLFHASAWDSQGRMAAISR